MNCIFGHKWTKWEIEKQYYYQEGYRDKDGNLIKFEKEVRRRKCVLCNYTEEFDI